MIPYYKKALSLLLVLVLLVSALTGCYYLKMPDPSSSSSAVTTKPIQNTVPTTTLPQVPTTTPPTTVPPVTEPPVTEPPVTEPPVTEPPVTEPPVTEPPVTEPPVTEPPVTEPPVTEPPVTEPPVTEPDPTISKIPLKDLPSISAKYAFIYDTRTQEFVYTSTDPSYAVYPASITKLFTTYVALQYLPLDTIVTVGNELSYVASDASIAGFHKGDKVSVKGLVYGALLPSGCDASYILAVAAGRVILGDTNASVKNALNAFLNACNQLAASMGMVNTNISSPDGYHKSSHYISLQAMAIIGILALENEAIAKACSSMEMTITYQDINGKERSALFHNTNRTLDPGSSAYHPLAIGLKTGTTARAGACLLNAYRVDGGYILVGVFACKDNTRRFSDANALFEACLPYI